MACSGCNERTTRAGCFCAYCNPDDQAAYTIATRAVWTLDAAGFTDGSAPFSMFNGTWPLAYTPQAANNCVWRYDTPLMEMRLIGSDVGTEFKVYFVHRTTGTELTYNVVGSFDCGGANAFEFAGGPAADVFPSGVSMTPGTLFTDCCFKVPIAELPSVLYATVQDLNGAACIAGSYTLTRDDYSFDTLRYRYWDGTDSIELSCGGESNGIYWNVIATLRGCRLSRGDCTGVLLGEDSSSTYDPFILSYKNLFVYPHFGDESCCGGSDDCGSSTNTSRVNLIVSQ